MSDKPTQLSPIQESSQESSPVQESSIQSTDTNFLPPAPPIPSAESSADTTFLPPAPPIPSAESSADTTFLPPAPPIPSTESSVDTTFLSPHVSRSPPKKSEDSPRTQKNKTKIKASNTIKHFLIKKNAKTKKANTSACKIQRTFRRFNRTLGIPVKVETSAIFEFFKSPGAAQLSQWGNQNKLSQLMHRHKKQICNVELLTGDTILHKSCRNVSAVSLTRVMFVVMRELNFPAAIISRFTNLQNLEHHTALWNVCKCTTDPQTSKSLLSQGESLARLLIENGADVAVTDGTTSLFDPSVTTVEFVDVVREIDSDVNPEDPNELLK